jgi:4-aminobutyrate aminotransferase
VGQKNPVTARAALTTIEIVEEEGLVENAAKLGALALVGLNDMRSRHLSMGNVRGRGLLLGVDLVKDRDSKAPADDLAEVVLYGCLDRGLSLKTSMGNIATLTRPLMIAEG